MSDMDDSAPDEGAAAGHTYLFQVARAFRFLDRYKAALESDVRTVAALSDLEDFLWAFFQNCWHVKDWLSNDETIDPAVRVRIVEAAEANDSLLVAADLANGTKHFALRKSRVGAREGNIEVHTQEDGSLRFDHMIDRDDGSSVPALVAAEAGMEAWRAIFEAHSLPFYYDPDTI